uniref:Uncharacterized protein n=1 Tax=Anguilla anguilla TaxID=7936 RepID=A0A0E9VYZ3_ANGAN
MCQILSNQCAVSLSGWRPSCGQVVTWLRT